MLYAAERLQRSTKAFTAGVWSLLQDITVGYGYRPARAALWLLARIWRSADHVPRFGDDSELPAAVPADVDRAEGIDEVDCSQFPG